MPRNGSGVYSLPAGSIVANGETIDASQHNPPLQDIASDLNTARPISAGGTGAATAAAALVNLGLTATASELNVLDGITATTAELNALDGVTAAGTALIVAADAAAQRTALGLGTAATEPIGTTVGTVPRIGTTEGTVAALAAGGVLPASVMGRGNSTPVTLSGSNVDFTGIPSTARRVTVMFNGLSTNGTTVPLVQLGDAGGIEATGYSGVVSQFGAGISTVSAALSTGVAVHGAWSATLTITGQIVFELADPATNLWVFQSILARGDAAANHVISGSKALSAVLTQIRITAGANTFDAGTASIKWE